MEDDGKLNPLNEVDMYCLHHVFLPRINASLKSFVESWNNHPVSTERNRTPNQLFIEGALQQSTSRALAQPSGTPLPSSHDPVQVPRSTFTPCIALKHSLDHVNTVRDSSDFGIDVYDEVVHEVGLHLAHGCRRCSLD